MSNEFEKIVGAIRQGLAEAGILKNGATVIDVASGKNGVFVLAKYHSEFVTWLMDDEGNTFHGNYFVDILDAAKDFKKRLNS